MRKLAIFAAAFSLATALFVYLLQDARALWLAGACLLLSGVCSWLRLRRISIAGLGAAMGILWCFVFSAVNLQPLQALVGQEQTVTVQVTELPRETKYGAAVDGVLKGSGVVIYGDEDLMKLQPGDLVTVTGDVEFTALSIRDGESLYLRARGVVLLIKSRSEPMIQPGTPTFPQQIRMWLQNRIHALYEGDAGGLVRALLTGDRSELSFCIQNELSVAGISHAVAVSGMHVSMLLMLVSLACGGSPGLMAVIGIPVSILFALMTGASPSVCRAAIMQVIFLLAPLAHREQDSVTTLGAAALIILLLDPWAIADVSFQLSFAAVAGLFLFSGPLQRNILSLKKKPGRLLRFVASTVSATLSATITTLPLTVYYFGLISIAAPLTNLLALWAVTGIFTLGLISCFLGPVGSVLAWPVTLLCQYVLELCGLIAAWPFAAAHPQNVLLMIWAVCAYVAALLHLLSRRKKPARWSLCGLTAAFLVCILMGNWSFTREAWRFTALDVGQGQCLLLQIGDYTAAVDCGGDYPDETGEELARTLHSAGVTHLDSLILTHYDLDHAGGALQLLERVEIGSLFLPTAEDESGIKAALETSGCPVFWVETLTEIVVPDGKIKLYPPIFAENGNNGSVSVLATAGEYDMLITGDLDRFGEMRLLSRWGLPDVELLVAGHHGAADSAHTVLLDAVRPETVIISVGETVYGHPAPETIARIEASGAEVLRTDELGDIVISPNRK